jgi:hypothetical protein
MRVLLCILFLCSFALAQEAPKSRGNSFNPDIGVNGLFLYRNSTRGHDPIASDPKNGFGVQEAEIQFASDVDPYLRAVANFALEKEAGVWEFAPEEIYGETIGLSLLSVKFGLQNLLVNKHNSFHTHAFPFIDAPLVNSEVLGTEEGLRDVGVSVAALVPTNWFMELTLQAFQGDSDQNPIFGSQSPNDGVGLAYLDTLFDLTEAMTLQLGGSFAQGQNQIDSVTRIAGGDLTVKWKPIGNDSIKTLKWSTHYLYSDAGDDPNPNVRKQGVSSYIQWQFDLRSWAQFRSEYTEQYAGGALGTVQRKNSVLYAFTPSEFSAFRVQLDQLEDGMEPIERRALVQMNWSIGAHPAHQY